MNRTITTYHGAELIEVEEFDVSWSQVRRKRNAALARSDWRALKDVTLTTPWRDYRQSLRDLGGFDSANDAADAWPVMPDA